MVEQGRLTALILCGVVALSGCATNDEEPGQGDSPSPDGAGVAAPSLPVEEIDCALGQDLGPRPPDEITHIAREPLPEQSVPVAAVLCVDTDPTDDVTAFAQRLYLGDLALLVDALRQDDITERADACDSYYDPQPNLWVMSEDGAVLAPRWPLDGCDHLRAPKPEELLSEASLGDPVPTTAPGGSES